MRWLLVKDLQLLRRSPLVTGLLVIYPIVLAVLIGLAISRSPEKPRVAFLNQIPQGAGLNLGRPAASARSEARRQLCAKIECVPASSRAEVEQKVKDGDVLGGLILPAGLPQQAAGRARHQLAEPATVEVLVNDDDPLKAQIVDDRISSLLTQANLLLSGKISDVAEQLRADPRQRRRVRDPVPQPDVHILGLRRSEQILNSSRGACRPAEARPGGPGQRLRPARAPEPGARGTSCSPRSASRSPSTSR